METIYEGDTELIGNDRGRMETMRDVDESVTSDGYWERIHYNTRMYLVLIHLDVSGSLLARLAVVTYMRD